MVYGDADFWRTGAVAGSTLSNVAGAKGDCVLVVKERASKILAATTIWAVPMPLPFMARTAEDTGRCSCRAQNQLRTTTYLAFQIKRELLMAFLADHLGIALVKSAIYLIPAIWVSDPPPLRIRFFFHIFA